MSTSSFLKQIVGRWRITEMEMWDNDYLDMEVEASIEFGSEGRGTFQFGLVRGLTDFRLTQRDDLPAVDGLGKATTNAILPWGEAGRSLRGTGPSQGRSSCIRETNRLFVRRRNWEGNVHPVLMN